MNQRYVVKHYTNCVDVIDDVSGVVAGYAHRSASPAGDRAWNIWTPVNPLPPRRDFKDTRDAVSAIMKEIGA